MSEPSRRMHVALTSLAIALVLPLVGEGAHAGQRNAWLQDLDEALPENFRFVLLRSYLPANGRDSVQLPSITVVKNGHSMKLPECPWRTPSLRKHRQAERAVASEDFDVRDVVRSIARILKLKTVGEAPYCA
jgi:hypothetical protein